MRDRFTSTTDTSSGCGTWTGGDTWICLLAWRLSVSATATRKAPFSFAVLHNDWHVFILLWRPVLLWHRKVTAAAEKQLKRLWHTTNIYVHPTLHEYCEKLASNLPDPLKVPWWSLMKRGQERCINTRVEVKTTAGLCFPLQVIYLTNSGTEANDLAMLMARLYTGNYEIITFRYTSYLTKTWKLRHVNSNSSLNVRMFVLFLPCRGSYHGGSQQTMGLTSNSSYKYPIATSSGCTHVSKKIPIYIGWT